MSKRKEPEIVRKAVYLRQCITYPKEARISTLVEPGLKRCNNLINQALDRSLNSCQTPKRSKPTILPRYESTPLSRRKSDSNQAQKRVGNLITDISPIKRQRSNSIPTKISIGSSGGSAVKSHSNGIHSLLSVVGKDKKCTIQNHMLALDESVLGAFDLENIERNYLNSGKLLQKPVSQRPDCEKRSPSPDIFSGGDSDGNQIETVTSDKTLVPEQVVTSVLYVEAIQSCSNEINQVSQSLSRVTSSQRKNAFELRGCSSGGISCAISDQRKSTIETPGCSSVCTTSELDQEWAELRSVDVDWANDSMVKGVMREASLHNDSAAVTSNAVPVGERIRRALVTNAQKPVTAKRKPTEKVNESERQESPSLQKETSLCFDIGPFFGLPSKVKLLIEKFKGIKGLYAWQEECLNLSAIQERRNLVYALPTSGGKTLVAEILILRELLCYKKNAIFILPYVSIVQEKVRSMSPFAVELNFLVEEYAAGKGQYPPRKRRWKRSVYIATIEKALGIVNSLIESGRLSEIGFVVVDEVHLLGDGGGRGATLEGLLTKLLHSSQNIHIVGMSATIGNLNELALFLRAEMYTKDFRPVELKEYIKCEDSIWAVNPNAKCEEDALTLVRTLSCPYTPKMAKMDPDRLGGLVLEVIPKDSCLVFCPTKKNCENVAVLICQMLPRELLNHKRQEKSALFRALMSEGNGSVCSVLRKTLPFGIVYHHSGLTLDERRLLEEAFVGGTLCCICCTSTLAAGVNLPARRVILRAPYIAKDFINLSRYKQMVGRAGRAGLESTGESILICKSSETQKVGNLLRSRMDDVCSGLHLHEGRDLRTLVLSAIGLGIATTRGVLLDFVQHTLLSVQAIQLGVHVKKLTDQAIVDLFKKGALRVAKLESKSDSSITGQDVSVRMSTSLLSPESISNKINSSPAHTSATNDFPMNTPMKRTLLTSSPNQPPSKAPSPVITPRRKGLAKPSPNRRLLLGGLFSPHHNSKRNNVPKALAKGVKRIVNLQNDTPLAISRLGKAAIKAPIELNRAHQLYKDLVQAQASLVLLSCLHLLYLVTPYDLVGQIKPVSNVYFSVYHELDIKDLQTARVIGISEACMLRIMNGQSVRAVSEQVVHRFYLTLMLNELWNQKSVWQVAEKYQVPRGTVQSMMTSAASFAGCVMRFCEELEEFWAFKELLVNLSQRLSHCCSTELLPLMELPAVKRGRAKQLFNAGYKTLKDIANADPRSLMEALDHMPKRTAQQIVAAAKLLLLEKIETLREEAEEVLEGLNIPSTPDV